MRVLRDERGQALIETAVSIGLFFVLLIGAVEFGGLAYAMTQVTDAAEAGAQYASQSSVTAANSIGMAKAAKNDSGASNLTVAAPTYTCNCSGSTASVSCTNNDIANPTCTSSVREVQVTVQTTAIYTPAIHIPGLPTSFNLTGTAKRKVLQ